MVSSSRFRARPSVPSSNSSSSLTAAPGKTRHPGDAVADLDDVTDLLGPDRRCVVLDVVLQRLGDLTGVDRQLCHQFAPSVSAVVVWSRPPRPNPAGCHAAGTRCSRSASIRPRAVASTWRSPIRIRAPLSSASSMTTWSSTGCPASPASESVEHRLLRLVDRGGGAHVGDAPAAGRGRLLDQEVQGAHEVARPATGHDVADQRQRRRRHLALQELADEPLARPRRSRSRSVSAARRAGVAATIRPKRKRSSSSDSSSLVRHVLVQRRGVAGHPSARLGQAQRRLLDHAALGGVPGPGGQPAQRGRHLRCRHHQAGEGGQPPGLGARPSPRAARA